MRHFVHRVAISGRLLVRRQLERGLNIINWGNIFKVFAKRAFLKKSLGNPGQISKVNKQTT